MNSTENEITVSCTNIQSEGGNGLSRKKKTGLLQENRLFFLACLSSLLRFLTTIAIENKQVQNRICKNCVN